MKGTKTEPKATHIVMRSLPIYVCLHALADEEENHWGWRVETQGTGNTLEFSFTLRISATLRKSVAVDAWQVREEFFTIDTPEDAQAFFERHGPYQFKNNDRGEDPLSIRYENLVRGQESFRNMLAQSLSDWRLLAKIHYKDQLEGKLRETVDDMYTWQPVSMNLRLTPFPQGVALFNGVKEAIRATILADKVKGAEWIFCFCGCGRAFEPTRTNRRYFDPSVCGNRKRQRDWKAKIVKEDCEEIGAPHHPFEPLGLA